MLPPHDCYIEVFGGAGWVLLGKESSKVEVFNDIDGDVINFFKVVKHKPNELIKSFEWELTSREEFERLRDLSVESLTDVQRAHRFYYLIMAAWGGELRTPRFQTSVSDGGHGNRLIGALKSLHMRVMPVHQRLQTVIIEKLSWEECIARYDRPYEEQGVVMYLDPPYPNNTINYQYNMRRMEEHRELVRALHNLQARFILTSYDLPEVRELYDHDGFYITPVDFAAGMPTNGNQRSRNREIIVTNYDPLTDMPESSD
jgi:DNA adenine methylase